MNYKVRKLMYKLTYKRINEDALDVVHMDIQKKDVSYFNLSSNSIISFDFNSTLYYFRECPKIETCNNYFENAVEYFFKLLKYKEVSKEQFKQEVPIKTSFKDEIVAKYYEYVKKKTNKSFFKVLSKTDYIAENIQFSIWDENKTYDNKFFESFGLYELPKDLRDIAIYFLWYMKGIATSYHCLKICRGDTYSYFNAVRSIASRVVCEELHLEHMITNVSWCELRFDDGESKFGLLSEAAPGTRMKDCEVLINGTLQRELINLNVLDLISFQMDHGPNNYNVKIDEDNNCWVCAFDNDNPYTFFPLPSLSKKMAGCAPFVNKNNVICRPYIDEELVEKIKNVNVYNLKKRLQPYLNFIQIRALILRLKKLQNAISKTKRVKTDYCVAAIDWNNDTAMREINGEYGITYLTKALKLD